jgi:Rod binding domain-containing protein
MSDIAISSAQLPTDVRADGAHGRKLYEAALGFEQTFVRELASQMTATLDSSDDSDDGSTTDAAAGVIQEQLPDALAAGVTSAGGLGLAHTLYVAMKANGGGVGSAAPPESGDAGFAGVGAESR